LKPSGRHQQPFAVPEAPSGTQVEATFADSCNICVSMGAPGKEIHAPSLQPVHKNEGGWRHHQVAVVSMGVPRRPQMRYTHQVRSLRTKTRGGLGTTVGSWLGQWVPPGTLK